MSRRKISGFVFLGLIVFIISAFFVRVVSQAGQFTTIKTVRTGVCQSYGGLSGPEDIVVDRETGTAFFSSLDRKLAMAGGANAATLRGTIQSVDLNNLKPGSAPAYKNVTPEALKQFQPLGLNLYTGKDGEKRLFVVNQSGAGKQTVEIFGIVSGNLVHEKTVDLGAAVVSANDVLAVGPEAFYVTDSASAGVTSVFLNFAFQRQRSKVFYFDGKSVKPAADGFVMANGIAKSASGETVYVLDTFARSLRFFKRDQALGTLTDNGVLFIGTGVDNIDVASDGSLWMAAHPKLIDFVLAAAGKKPVSPSQVIQAVPGKKSGGEVRTTYLDLGEDLSGSSVAVSYGKRFIIGSALDDKFVICERK